MLNKKYAKRGFAILLAVALSVPTIAPSPATKTVSAASSEENTFVLGNNNTISTKDSDGNYIYGGDPSILVEGDTVYLYTGHDVANGEDYNIPEYLCYSTKDLKTWTYHGVVMSMKDVSWDKDDNAAWAGPMSRFSTS